MIDTVPVLHKKASEPNYEDIKSFLKSIDSRLEDIPSEFGKRQSKGVDLKTIEKRINELDKLKNRSLNINNLSKKDFEKYSEIQSRNIEKLISKISTSFDDIREEILSKEILSKEDSNNLAKIGELKAEFANKYKSEDSPIQDLKDTIAEFVKVREYGVDTSGMSSADEARYLKQQRIVSKEQEDEIKSEIISTRNDILNKKELSEADKEVLSQLKNYEIALKTQYGVKQKFSETDFAQTFVGEKLSGVIEKLDEFGKDVVDGSKKMADEVTKGLLGPLNLIFEPISDLFGFSISNLLGNEFTKKGKKIKPRRGDILKSNPEIVWAVEESKKSTKVKDKDKKDFNLLNAASIAGLIGTILPVLLPMLGIVVGVTGFALMMKKLVDDTTVRNKKRDEAITSIESDPEKVAELKSRGIAVPQKGTGMMETANAALAISEKKGHLVDTSDVTSIVGADDENAKLIPLLATDRKKYVAGVQKALLGEKGNIFKDSGLYWKKENDKYFVSKDSSFKNQYEYPLVDTEKSKLANLYGKQHSKEYQTQIIEAMEKGENLFDYLLSKGPTKFHNGSIGRVPGNRTTEVPALLLGREKVLSANQADEFDRNNMDYNMAQLSKSVSEGMQSNNIISMLKSIVDAINKKPFNNIAQTSVVQSYDFDKLRGSLQ